MLLKKIVTQQSIPKALYERAKELRNEMTPAETQLWQRLRAGRLAGIHFRRQQIIGRFIVDFYCHQAGLVVEIDDGIHHEQADYDLARDNYLCERGLRVMRFTNLEVEHELETVLGVILEACNLPPTLPFREGLGVG